MPIRDRMPTMSRHLICDDEGLLSAIIRIPENTKQETAKIAAVSFPNNSNIILPFKNYAVYITTEDANA